MTLALGRLLLAGLLTSSAVQAQDLPKAAGPGRAAAPPVTVPGFRYDRFPPQTHLNTCTDAKCGPGSKVSYILFPPDPKPDFERFKTMRGQVQRALEQRLPMGARLAVEPPAMTSDAMFIIFEQKRTETLLDGRTTTVITRQLYAKRFAVELISSASDAKTAEANAALFQMPLMLAGEK